MVRMYEFELCAGCFSMGRCVMRTPVGATLGDEVSGDLDGDEVDERRSVGRGEGAFSGAREGVADGAKVGPLDGDFEGASVGVSATRKAVIYPVTSAIYKVVPSVFNANSPSIGILRSYTQVSMRSAVLA